MLAFAAVVPRRYGMVLGIICAASLGAWYFASLEESKIVTATLTALYIAAYLHLRKRWDDARSRASPEASDVFPGHPGEKYFEPVLASYFLSPLSAGLVAFFVVMLVAIALPRYRARNAAPMTAILSALGAYALVRGMFFPHRQSERMPPLRFRRDAGASVADRHTVCRLAPSRKARALSAFALLLFVVNGTFIVGS